MKQYDIVIAGGAMAGATLALALSHQSVKPISIAVVEPYPSDSRIHPGFDSRSIALSYGTKLILESFGLWDKIAPLTTSINHIHVSDRGHMGMTEIEKGQQNVPALGYVVELEAVGSLYNRMMSADSNIDYFCPASVSAVERDKSQTLVSLSSGEMLSCHLLVAADGADSKCCKMLKLSNMEYDFEQVAIIANVDISEPHRGRAFERFTPMGPLAFLPMSDNRMSVVWCLTPEAADKIIALSDKEFSEQLQEAFGWRLGRIVKSGKRASYPLILKKKEQVVSHRFVAVGNAAQLLHPIAGQGFNLGIRDIRDLIGIIVNQQDMGDYSLLAAYRNARQQDRDSTIGLIAGMVHIFSNEWLSMCIGRNLALLSMDNIAMLKAPLLKRTMGLVGK